MKTFYIIFAIFIASTLSLMSEAKKMVIVEEYSSAYCGTCGYFDPTFKAVTNQNINDVIPLSFHTGNQPGDIMYKHNPQVSSRFAYVYGLSSIGTPAVWIDGKKVNYTDYGTLPTYTGGMSPVGIKVIEERTSDKLNITVGVESDIALSNHNLYIFVVEDNLYYPNAGTNGVKNFRWIVRKGVPNDVSGTKLNLNSSGKQGFNYSIDWHPEWNKDNIHVVAFVQSTGGNNKDEIINAAKTGTHSAEAVISSSVPKLDFGDVSDKKVMEFQLVNDGLKDLDISDISLNNNDDGVFSIKFGQSTSKIAAYGSAKIVVEYFPKENGDYQSQLVVQSNAANKAIYKVDLVGKATNIVPFGQITTENSTVDFGVVSELTTKNVIVSNVGTGSLNIESITLDYNDDNAYKILLESTTNLVLMVGESLTIPVSFEPKENDKFYFGDLLITSDSKEEAEFMISLTGRGKDISSGPSLVLSDGAEKLEYGEIEAGKITSFKVRNTSDTDIQVIGISFEDFEAGSNDSEAFQLVSAQSTWVVANSETSIAFKFNPTESKIYKVFVNLTTVDGEDDLRLELTATANVASVFGNELSSTGLLNLNISPNPVTNNSEIRFENNSNEKLTLDLFNSNGEFIRNVFEGLSSNQVISFNSSNLSNGKYYLIANINGKKEAYSLIITK